MRAQKESLGGLEGPRQERSNQNSIGNVMEGESDVNGKIRFEPELLLLYYDY
jgi:hypothetical protein